MGRASGTRQVSPGACAVPVPHEDRHGSARGFDTLADCERVIRRGLSAYVEVGRALREIHERELWKQSAHGSFLAYCRTRFELRSSQVYNIMRASKIADEATARGDKPPRSIKSALSDGPHRRHRQPPRDGRAEEIARLTIKELGEPLARAVATAIHRISRRPA